MQKEKSILFDGRSGISGRLSGRTAESARNPVCTEICELVLENGNVSYQEKQLLPDVSYDHNKLTAYLDGCSYLKDNSEDKNRVIEIRRNTDGYYLYDETQNLLNHEKAVQAIEKALDAQEYEIDLAKADCYETFAYTSQMKQTLALWDALSPYMNTEITYESSQGDYVIDRKR